VTIAKRVRDCRYAKGWGPDELTSRAAISRTALYQIECGKTETPRAGTLRRIAQALEVGKSVKISGFGTFSVRQKGRRIGRNPKTGVEVPILPRRVLVFRPSQMLRDAVNEPVSHS